MTSVAAFGAVILTAAVVIVAAALFSRVSERLRIPAPAFFRWRPGDRVAQVPVRRRRGQVSGRSGVLVEAESGANDPVGITGAGRVYSVIFVVVAFSVLAQGSTVPTVARRLKIPMTVAAVEPWSIGLRLRQEPEGVHRLRVRPGNGADETAIGDLELPEDARVSLVIRGGKLVPVQASTTLKARDEVLVLAGDDQAAELASLFTQPRAGPAADQDGGQ